MPYRVAQRGGKFRVVKGGSPDSSIDNGGFNSRQSALDAAMKANKKISNILGTQRDPLDYTDQYNTPLPAGQKSAYRAWAKMVGRDPVQGRYDYDLQGAYLAGLVNADNLHLGDRFKKPNHPTFSTNSKYSKAGQEGGVWTHNADDSWTFQPSPFVLRKQGPGRLQEYWSRVEAPNGNHLVIPKGVRIEGDK